MNLETRIEFAVRSMDREYRGTAGQAMMDDMVADLRREHYRALRARLLRSVQGVLRTLGGFPALPATHPAQTDTPHRLVLH